MSDDDTTEPTDPEIARAAALYGRGYVLAEDGFTAGAEWQVRRAAALAATGAEPDTSAPSESDELAAIEQAAHRIGEIIRRVYARQQAVQLGFARGLGVIADGGFPMCEHTVTVEYGYKLPDAPADDDPIRATEGAARWHVDNDDATAYHRQVDTTEWVPVTAEQIRQTGASDD